VAGFIRASGGLESNAANKMQVGTRQAQPLELLTNNKAAMTIDAAGKIGIGMKTEPPRDSRRRFSLSQAAAADSSCWR
jgi:hypothetical protein